MKQIDFKLIIEIQRLIIQKFEIEDDYFVDYRIVRAKERAINNRLSKITSNKKEQGKIFDIIEKGSWRTDDLSYKCICDELRALGYEILNKENK